MQIELNLNEISRAITTIYGNVDMTPFRQRVGEVIVSDIKLNVFDKLGYPSNAIMGYAGNQISWPSLALSTMIQRARGMKKRGSNQYNEKPSWPPPKGLILQRTGNLRESINYRLTSDGVMIGAGMDYGKYLQARFPFMILTMTAMDEIAEQARLFFAQK